MAFPTWPFQHACHVCFGRVRPGCIMPCISIVARAGVGGLHASINAGAAPATSGSICQTPSIPPSHPDDVGNRALYRRGQPGRWVAKQAKLGPRAQMRWRRSHEP